MEFGSKNRPVIFFEGTPYGVRVVPHKTDSDRLVLKGNASVVEIVEEMAIEGEAIAAGEGRGGFFAVAVNKHDFLEAVPLLLSKALEGNVPTEEAPEPEPEVLEDVEDGEDEETPGSLLDMLN